MRLFYDHTLSAGDFSMVFDHHITPFLGAFTSYITILPSRGCSLALLSPCKRPCRGCSGFGWAAVRSPFSRPVSALVGAVRVSGGRLFARPSLAL